MGRRQYLERLALGRSAYQQDTEPERPTEPTASPSTQQATNASYVQQYDSRGRPVNPTIERFNADQRKAQNEVLALVGVVEKKDATEHASGVRYESIAKERRRLLAIEQERGEMLESVVFAASFLCHLWPGAFRQRIQVGLYDPSRSVADILSTEWRDTFRCGGRWSVARCFPGIGETMTYLFIRLPLIYLAEQSTGALQNWVQRAGFKRKTEVRLHRALGLMFELLILGIDIAMMPIEFHSATQRLGLVSALPLLPNFQSFLPYWRPTSFHSFGWQGVAGPRFMRRLTSPAAILLVHKMIAYDAADSVLPIFHLITDFRFPELESHPSKIEFLEVSRDPVGWVLCYCYSIRVHIMRLSGWTIVKRNKRNELRRSSEEDYESNTRPVGDAEASPVHRSTILAQLPAQFLSDAIDALFSRVLNLPFEAMMMRAIATSFMSSSAGMELSSATAMSRVYAPFGHGPLTYGWSAFGQYAARIGLSLALTAAVDVVLFHGIYSATRNIGIKCFDWGRKGKIGKIIYSEEGFQTQADAAQAEDHMGQVH